MEYSGGVDLKGLDKLLKGFKKQSKAVRDAAMLGLEEGGLAIIAQASVNLRDNGSVVTGLLRQSGKVQKRGEASLDVGFFDTKNRGGYAAWVEYGRRSGKMPPPDALAAYAYKKLRLREWKEAASVGFLMARAIAKKGTKPHPFFAPAVSKMQKKIIEAMKARIDKAIDGSN